MSDREKGKIYNKIIPVIIVVIVVAVGILAFHFSNPTALPANTSKADYNVNNTYDLELSSAISNTSIVYGKNITVQIAVSNLDSSDNTMPFSAIYPSFNGNYSFPNSEDKYLPMGIAVLKGNFSKNNLSDATPLNIFPTSAAEVDNQAVNQYEFLPASTRAYADTDAGQSINVDFSYTYSLGGYFSGNSTQLIYFSPGSYTVIGADGWGMVTVLHFSVSWAS
jgi:flagellar basal body-associated protein FliL